MQFGINKTTKIERARRTSAICSLRKLQIAREKSCDYLLVIYMKKFEKVKRKKLTRINQGKIAPSRARA